MGRLFAGARADIHRFRDFARFFTRIMKESGITESAFSLRNFARDIAGISQMKSNREVAATCACLASGYCHNPH